MNASKRKRWILATILFAAASATAVPASAAPVSIRGGFFSYSGPVWDKTYTEPVTTVVSTSFSLDHRATVAAQLTVPLPGDPGGVYGTAGLGMGELDIFRENSNAPARTVEFWQSVNGSPTGAVNAVAFVPGPPVDVQIGQEFLIGTFTFTNGGWFGVLPVGGNTYTYPESQFYFSAITDSPYSDFSNHVFASYLNLHVTGADPGAPPADDADYFYFVSRPDLGYVGAYEPGNLPIGGSSTGTVEMRGRIGSLVPTRFTNPQGVVLASTLPDGGTAPEPGTALLVVAGLGLLLRRDLWRGGRVQVV